MNSHPVHPGEGCIVVVVVPVVVVSERVARGTGGHHTPSSTTSQTPATVALTPCCGDASPTATRIKAEKQKKKIKNFLRISQNGFKM